MTSWPNDPRGVHPACNTIYAVARRGGAFGQCGSLLLGPMNRHRDFARQPVSTAVDHKCGQQPSQASATVPSRRSVEHDRGRAKYRSRVLRSSSRPCGSRQAARRKHSSVEPIDHIASLLSRRRSNRGNPCCRPLTAHRNRRIVVPTDWTVASGEASGEALGGSRHANT